jgi:hypothetical protein
MSLNWESRQALASDESVNLDWSEPGKVKIAGALSGVSGTHYLTNDANGWAIDGPPVSGRSLYVYGRMAANGFEQGSTIQSVFYRSKILGYSSYTSGDPLLLVAPAVGQTVPAFQVNGTNGAKAFSVGPDGTCTISNAATVNSTSRELVLSQTGDTYGTTKLHLQARDGAVGATFENAGTIDAVDFRFQTSGATNNIRMEHRPGNLSDPLNLSGEVSFLNPAASLFWFRSGTNSTTISGRLNAGSLTAGTNSTPIVDASGTLTTNLLTKEVLYAVVSGSVTSVWNLIGPGHYHWAQHTPSGVTNSTTPTTVAQCAIAGGMIGSNGTVTVSGTFRVENWTNTSATVRMNGTIVTYLSPTSLSMSQSLEFCRSIRNRGADSQITFINGINYSFGPGSNPPVVSSVDTATNTTLSIVLYSNGLGQTNTLESVDIDIVTRNASQ